MCQNNQVLFLIAELEPSVRSAVMVSIQTVGVTNLEDNLALHVIVTRLGRVVTSAQTQVNADPTINNDAHFSIIVRRV